ncbi:MAG: glycosyl hydrolase, partial [Pirellulales bacterium]
MRREVVTWQLETLAAKGVRSVCPIQRSPGRCDPPSFSPEWWEMFTFVASECRRLGMTLWAYDQVGYGHYGWLEKAAAKAHDRRTRRLAMRIAESADGQVVHIDLPEGTLIGARAYPLSNGLADDAHSIDLADQVHDRLLNWQPPQGAWRVAVMVATPELVFQLSDQAADTFIDMLYGEVERRLGTDAMGTTFAGMFQDEHPPTPRNIVTDRLIEAFQRQHGYPLARAIAALHFDVGPRTPKYRIDYFDTYLALDEACYWKRVYDWTARRGILTSHDNWGRGNIARQSQGYIDYFRTQRWFSAPGYDDAGIRPIEQRNYYDTKIAASIARLYRRPRVWSEAFHSSGWGRTTNQTLSWLTTNYAFGANLYDEHGLYYSVRAGTWEHAAPDPHWRQPYWRYYGHLSDWVARMSYLMAQGSHVVDVAVHYPVVSLLAGEPAGTKAPDYNRYMRLSRAIYDAGIDNDIIDDDSILNAKIEAGKLWVAGNGYQALVFGPERTVRMSVLKKALAFAEQGGTVLFVGGLPSATVEQGRGDTEAARCLAQLVGPASADRPPLQATSKEHPRGGHGGLVASDPQELVACVDAHIERDFKADAGTFYVAHRRMREVDVYLVQNVAQEGVDLAATFRVDGVAERWDPATGRVDPVDAFRRDGKTTRVWQRLEGNAAFLFVFRPGDARGITGLSEPARPVVRERKLDEEWEFSVIPTRDNRWGEFRWPPSNDKIGPEIR